MSSYHLIWSCRYIATYYLCSVQITIIFTVCHNKRTIERRGVLAINTISRNNENNSIDTDIKAKTISLTLEKCSKLGQSLIRNECMRSSQVLEMKTAKIACKRLFPLYQFCLTHSCVRLLFHQVKPDSWIIISISESKVFAFVYPNYSCCCSEWLIEFPGLSFTRSGKQQPTALLLILGLTFQRVLRSLVNAELTTHIHDK